MERKFAACLQDNAEFMTPMSFSHLSPTTHRKLADDGLSVNAYPTDCGGIIYFGTPRYCLPTSRVRMMSPQQSNSRFKTA